MTKKDSRTTARELDHYFGNTVAFARRFHNKQVTDCDIGESQVYFLEGLERTLADNVPEAHGVTKDHLRELIELGREDWSDINTIKGLYKAKYKITGQEYDEERLFGRE